MSIRIEKYIIYGIKFGEEFTKEFWKKEFYDKEVWEKSKPKDKPYFLTDGMSGEYTFFGFIQELSDGFNEPEEKVINLSFTDVVLISRLYELYPDIEINTDDIKMYFLPHYV